jgi:hypothetical protein
MFDQTIWDGTCRWQGYSVGHKLDIHMDDKFLTVLSWELKKMIVLGL